MSSIEVFVRSITYLAEDVHALEFCRPDFALLPEFTAGAHIDVFLPSGLVRNYSLCSSQGRQDAYVVAVHLAPNSRGGSREIHDRLKPGSKLFISAPRNNFPLIESAEHSILIAGGIGITPIYGMIQRLDAFGASWELHYSTRRRELCAFRRELEAIEAARPGRVHFNFDGEQGGKLTDIGALVNNARGGSHFYCCGPLPMLDAFQKACALAGIGKERIHFELFSARESAATDASYTVVLRRSGRELTIPKGSTILSVLMSNNIPVPYSCMQGVCGTCETRVIDGIPDHRDTILSESERQSGKTMMICCSGSKSARMTLDL